MTETVDLTSSCKKYLASKQIGFGEHEFLATYSCFVAGFDYFSDRSEEKVHLLVELFDSFLPYIASLTPSISFAAEKAEPSKVPSMYLNALKSFSLFEKSEGKDVNLYLAAVKDVVDVLNSALVGFASDPSIYVS